MAVNLLTKHSNFISRSAQASITILENIEELRRLRREADLLAYGLAITDADFIGDNDHIAKADLVAAFGAIDTLVAALVANQNQAYVALYRMVR